MYKLFYLANGDIKNIEKMANSDLCSTLSLDGNLTLTGTGVLSANSIIIKNQVIDFNQIKTIYPLYNIIFGFINPQSLIPPFLPYVFGLKSIEFFDSEFKTIINSDKFNIKNIITEGKYIYQFKPGNEKDVLNNVVYVTLKFVTNPGITISFTTWMNGMEIVFASFTSTTKETGDMINTRTFKIQ
jgi:hypothetical protein